MKQYLLSLLLLCFMLIISLEVSAQRKFKNHISLTSDCIHSLSKSYNMHQNVRGYGYDLSAGITLAYDRIFKDRYFIGAKIGYYYIASNINFPGDFPILDHSMNGVGQINVDALPIGLNVGVIHNFNPQWSISFHLGLYSYMLYRPIPSGYITDLNGFLRVSGNAQVHSFGFITAAHTDEFIHTYEIGHTITYSPTGTFPISFIMNNHLRIGFRPYINYEMLVYTTGFQGDGAFHNSTTSMLSSLLFTSLGVRYGF